MSDIGPDLERKSERFGLAPGALDRLLERRRRKNRNRRIRAGILGMIVAVVAIGGLVRAFSRVDSRVPASPTGGTIVFTRQDLGTDIDYIYVIDPTSPDTTKPLQIGSGDFLSVSPDGTRIMFALFDTTGTALQWVKPAVVNMDGTGRRVLPVTDPSMSGLVPTGWSPDGTRFVAEGIDRVSVGVYTARSSDGEDLVQLTVAPPGGKDRPVGGYSPDGSRIMFVRPVKNYGGQDADQNLFVTNTDGSDLVRLTPAGTTTGWDQASWSPDGAMVTFVGSKGRFLEAPRALFVVDADGRHPRRITPWGVIDGAEWSPDGQWIAFSQAHPKDRDLFLVHPDGTQLTQVTTSADGLSSSGPVWAPDGTKLLFARSSTGFAQSSTGGPFDSDLWIVNTDRTGLVQITHRPAEYYQYAWAGLAPA